MEANKNLSVTVRIPPCYARAFLAALTGNDDDVLLAAEKAIRERLAEEVEQGEVSPFEDVEILGVDSEDTLDLSHIADRERTERRTYGPYAE